MGKATELQACLLFTVVASGFQCFVVLFQVDLVEGFFWHFHVGHVGQQRSGPREFTWCMLQSSQNDVHKLNCMCTVNCEQ